MPRRRNRPHSPGHPARPRPPAHRRDADVEDRPVAWSGALRPVPVATFHDTVAACCLSQALRIVQALRQPWSSHEPSDRSGGPRSPARRMLRRSPPNRRGRRSSGSAWASRPRSRCRSRPNSASPIFSHPDRKRSRRSRPQPGPSQALSGVSCACCPPRASSRRRRPEPSRRRRSATRFGRMRRASPRDFLRMIGREPFLAWARLLDAVRTGRPSFELVFGAPRFDWLAQNPEAAALFQAAMVALGGDVVEPIATGLRLRRSRRRGRCGRRARQPAVGDTRPLSRRQRHPVRSARRYRGGLGRARRTAAALRTAWPATFSSRFPRVRTSIS